MATITNAGLNLLASAIQSAGTNCAITYVGLSAGCGTLATAITSGVATTSLALNAGLPAALSSGQGLTVTDGTNSETVTVSAGGAAQGATSITINSWTPVHSYAINVTGVCPTPGTSDVALYGEGVRVAANAGVSGANPGESLNSAYFDGTQSTAVYLLVGYFGGSGATASTGTGTLIAEDIQYWSHTVNADSASYQLDSTI